MQVAAGLARPAVRRPSSVEDGNRPIGAAFSEKMTTMNRLPFLALALALPLAACAPDAPPAAPAAAGAPETLQPYVDALADHGREPVAYVRELLADHDLLLFDDALHNAVEPFDLYRRLLADPQIAAALDFVFLETVPINGQPALDAYLAAEEDDPTLLYPAFQDDTSGFGFAYGTYFDLLRGVRQANAALPEGERIAAVAVSNPTWWCAVETPRDVELFRRGLLGRDYDMYRVILSDMEDFAAGKKGIFLTNTRHAYTGVRRPDGSLYWNAGTFFRQHHPGRTWSLRIHGPALYIESAEAKEGAPETTEGLSRYEYRWGRMAGGLWDRAFAAHGRPVALPFAGTPFGATGYVGNHMAEAAPGQTMADAYDALVYVAPLEELHQARRVGELYTPEFQREVARRLALLYTPQQIDGLLAGAGVETVEAWVAKLAAGEPQAPSAQAAAVGELPEG